MVQIWNYFYNSGHHVLSYETLSSQIILVYTEKSVMLKMGTKKQNQPQSQLGLTRDWVCLDAVNTAGRTNLIPGYKLYTDDAKYLCKPETIHFRSFEITKHTFQCC